MKEVISEHSISQKTPKRTLFRDRSSWIYLISVTALLLFMLSRGAQAASISIEGNYTFGGNHFTGLDLGYNAPNTSHHSAYIENRFLLKPKILIDERFSIETEVSLFPHNASYDGLLGQNYFYNSGVFDGNLNAANNNAIQLNRAYLVWESDYGVFRAGRMPKAWGLGLLYDPGNDPWSVAGTTADRIEFIAKLGALSLSLGYDKNNEDLIHRDSDDSSTYDLGIVYEDAERELDVGLLYSKKTRLANSTDRTVYNKESSDDVSFFVKKQWEKTFSTSVEAAAIIPDGSDTVFGALAQLRWEPTSAWKAGIDFALASASVDTGAGTASSFLFHPNYRPMMIMYNQNLAQNAGQALRSSYPLGGDLGDYVGSGSTALPVAGLGAYFGKASLSYGFKANKYVLGGDLAYAMAYEEGSNASSNLGIEADLHLTQNWYSNFKTVYAVGAYFPGDALGANAEMTWGAQFRGYLSF